MSVAEPLVAAISAMGKWALRYAERGFEVFPLRPKGKEPVTARGMKDATTNSSVIETWWKVNPQANIGIRPAEGVVVVDFDSLEAWERCLRDPKNFPLPETVTTRTGRGRHLWYRAPGPVKQAKVMPGVDTRTRDGYVVAPPSVHPLGGSYEWETPPPKEGEVYTDGFAMLPEWIWEKVRDDRTPQFDGEPQERGAVETPSSDRLVDRILSGLGEGERNDSFFKYVARLRGLGIDRREALLLAEFAFSKVSQAGETFTREEAERCFESAWRYTPEEAKKAALGMQQASQDVEFLPIEQLMARDYPPVRWLVPGLLSDGLVILASSPKIGKSWWCLNLALSVSNGSKILGHYECEKGEVLYLDLEQPARKTQARIQKMSVDAYGNSRLPPGGWRGVTFAHRFPRMNEGGLELMDRWLSAHPACRLVVVDVMAKVKPLLNGKGNIYDEGYQIWSDLKLMFDRHQVAGVIVTHDRKATEGDQVDRVHGDRSLVGAADAVMVLSRQRGQKTGLLFATGREIEDRTMEMTFDAISAQWIVTDPHFKCAHEDVRRMKDGTRCCVACGEIVTAKSRESEEFYV